MTGTAELLARKRKIEATIALAVGNAVNDFWRDTGVDICDVHVAMAINTSTGKDSPAYTVGLVAVDLVKDGSPVTWQIKDVMNDD